MKSKLARFTSRNVPLARPTKCSKCESPFHTSLQCSQGRSPIERTTRVKPKRATRRRSSRVLCPHYIAWIYTQTCDVPGCSSPAEPEHERQGVGMGQKASDRRAWRCCRLHHVERHAMSGFFKHMKRPALRSFIATNIDRANVDYEREHPPALTAA